MNENNTNELLTQSIAVVSQALAALTTREIQNKDTIDDLNGRLEKVEVEVQSKTLNRTQKKNLKSVVNARIATIFKDEYTPEYKRYAPTFFKRLWSDLDNKFGAPNYDEILQADYEKAIEYANEWNPHEGKAELMRKIDLKY